MKSGKLNFLEPSGPLQACNGTALPLCLQLLFIYTIATFGPWYSNNIHDRAKGTNRKRREHKQNNKKIFEIQAKLSENNSNSRRT